MLEPHLAFSHIGEVVGGVGQEERLVMGRCDLFIHYPELGCLHSAHRIMDLPIQLSESAIACYEIKPFELRCVQPLRIVQLLLLRLFALFRFFFQLFFLFFALLFLLFLLKRGS